jgi:hypothetical protein
VKQNKGDLVYNKFEGLWNFNNLLENICEDSDFDCDKLKNSFKKELECLIINLNISYCNLFKTSFGFFNFDNNFAIYMDDQVLINRKKWPDSKFRQLIIIFHELTHRALIKSGITNSMLGEFLAEFLAIKTIVNCSKKDLLEIVVKECKNLEDIHKLGAMLAADINDNELLSPNERENLIVELNKIISLVNNPPKLRSLFLKKGC